MAGKSTISAADRAEILKLARSGLGCRSIEARMGGRVKKTAIAELVAQHRKGNAAPATLAAPPVVEVHPAAVVSQPAAMTQPSPAELEAEAAEVLDAADRAHDRLDALHAKLTARVDQELALPSPDLRTLTGVSKLMLEVAVTLARTRPPVAIRPEDDPTNLAAAEQLLDRLGRLIADARRRNGLDVPAQLVGA